MMDSAHHYRGRLASGGTEEALEGRMRPEMGVAKSWGSGAGSPLSACPVTSGKMVNPAFLCLQLPIFKMGALTGPTTLRGCEV